MNRILQFQFYRLFRFSKSDRKIRSLKSVEEEGFARLFFFRSTDDSAGWTSNVAFFRRRGAPRASTADIFGATTRSNCPRSHRRCSAGYLSPLIFSRAPVTCFLPVSSSSVSPPLASPSPAIDLTRSVSPDRNNYSKNEFRLLVEDGTRTEPLCRVYRSSRSKRWHGFSYWIGSNANCRTTEYVRANNR